MMTYRPLVVTGTDTGVGKTQAAAGLAVKLCAHGIDVAAFKPMESGVIGPVGTDAEILARASCSGQETSDAMVYTFRTPVAPVVAAPEEGIVVETALVMERLAALRERHDLVIVEGAGGLLAPLAPGWDLLELAKETGAACLVVVANKLGCLNHSLLTQRILEDAGVTFLGFLFNDTGAKDPSAVTNANVLRRTSGRRIWGEMPRFDLAAHPRAQWGGALPPHFDVDAFLAALKV
ncbi:MAG: dethiobiotin synthase [Deltaproteobacteria bacterium]|nr:dethiobiotin synthase [Deltaproteobacteria bacterium]